MPGIREGAAEIGVEVRAVVGDGFPAPNQVRYSWKSEEYPTKVKRIFHFTIIIRRSTQRVEGGERICSDGSAKQILSTNRPYLPFTNREYCSPYMSKNTIG